MSERNPDSGPGIALSAVELIRPIRLWTGLSWHQHGPLELHDGYVVWRQHGNTAVIIPLSNVSHCYPYHANQAFPDAG